MTWCFNRRRDACFPATGVATRRPTAGWMFQSQTRRLLPRNYTIQYVGGKIIFVSIADATLASPQQIVPLALRHVVRVSIADATLASPQRNGKTSTYSSCWVSIADATLASPQQSFTAGSKIQHNEFQSQTRRLLPRNVFSF